MQYTRVIEWPVVSTEPLVFTGGVAWFRLMNDPSFVWRPNLIYGIKAGLLTDFTSVPRLLRPIVGQVGLHSAAAVFHDAGYARKLLIQSNGGTWRAAILTRADADLMFLDLLACARMGLALRLLVWLAVRLGGRQAWIMKHAS